MASFSSGGASGAARRALAAMDDDDNNNNNNNGVTAQSAFLRKQGDDFFGAWKSRLFRLQTSSGSGSGEPELAYFKSERDQRPQGTIALSLVDAVEVVEGTTTRVDIRMKKLSSSDAAGDARVFHLDVAGLSSSEQKYNESLGSAACLVGGGASGFAQLLRGLTNKSGKDEGGSTSGGKDGAAAVGTTTSNASSSGAKSEAAAAGAAKKQNKKEQDSDSDSGSSSDSSSEADVSLGRLSQDDDRVSDSDHAGGNSSSGSESNASSHSRKRPDKLGGMLPEWTKGVKQNVQVRVHIIEAMELQPRDSNNMSDPVCHVRVFGEKQETATYHKTTSALWDHYMIFESAKVTRDEFEQETLTIRVDDANTILRDVEIGSFEVDLATVYVATSQVGKKKFPHELFQRWVALADSKSKFEGVQGYVKLSIGVFVGDDTPTMHDAADEFDGSGKTKVSDMQAMLISNPRISTSWLRLNVSAFRGVDLPALDRGIGGKSDPFVQVRFGNRKVDSKIVKNELAPVWDEAMGLSVSTPSLVDGVSVRVVDWDRGVKANDIIGTLHFSLAKIRDGALREPRWHHLYGSPPNMHKDILQHRHLKRLARRMDDGRVPGSVYRGAVLLSAEAHKTSASAKPSVSPVSPARAPRTQTFVVRCEVHEGRDIHSSNKVSLRLACGGGQFEVRTKSESCKNGTVSWYELPKDSQLTVPQDPQQRPDLFVELWGKRGLASSSKRIAYVRIPLSGDPLPNGSPGHAVLNRMAKGPEWIDFLPDVFDAHGDDERLHFGGVVRMRLTIVPDDVELPARPKVSPPSTRAFQLRAHLFGARNLPAGDDDGASDPYCVVKCGAKRARSRVCRDTNWPQWYETVLLDNLELPEEKERRPPVHVRIKDKDTIGRDDFLGRFSVDTNKLSEKLPSPKYYKLAKNAGEDLGLALTAKAQLGYMFATRAEEEGEQDDADGTAPSVLAMFQLIPQDQAAQLKIAPLSPKMRPCTVTFSLVGIRDVLPYYLLPLQNPKVEIDLVDSKEHRVSASTPFLGTGVMAKLTGNSEKSGAFTAPNVSCNFLENLSIDVNLPEDALYAPALNVRVIDQRGARKRTVATRSFSLAAFMPWVDAAVKASERVTEIETKKSGGVPKSAAGKDSDDRDDHAVALQDGLAAHSAATKESSRQRKLMEDKLPSDVKDLHSKAGKLAGSGFKKGVKTVKLGSKKASKQAKKVVVKRGTASSDSEDSDTKSLESAERGESVSMESIYTADSDDDSEDDDSVENDPMNRDSVEAELELELGEPQFSKFSLYRATAGSMFESGAAHSYVCGSMRASVHVRDRSGKAGKKAGKATADDSDDSSSDEEDQLPDLAELFHERPVVARVYVLSGYNLVPHDKHGNNPYLIVSDKDGRTTLTNRKDVNPKQDTCRPQFYQCFEIPLQFPRDSQLVISCMDWDKYSQDDLIGRTTIDLEHRLFSRKWSKQKRHPIEHRSLWSPSSRSPQGVLKMWIDVLPEERARIVPPLHIAPPQPVECELRVIIWNTSETARKDEASMGLKARSDVFLTVVPETVPGIDKKIDAQKTDIHRNCEDGKGMFNWRMKFPLSLPRKHARVKITVWDADYISANDAIAEGILDLRDFYGHFYANHDKQPSAEIKRSWIALSHVAEGNDTVQSKVELSVEIMTLDHANRNSNGFGREEQNRYPRLEEPNRPAISRVVPWRPDQWVSQVAWGRNKKMWYAIGGGICCLLIIILFIYLMIQIGPWAVAASK